MNTVILSRALLAGLFLRLRFFALALNRQNLFLLAMAALFQHEDVDMPMLVPEPQAQEARWTESASWPGCSHVIRSEDMVCQASPPLCGA